ncbi:MAG: pyruvate kinase [Pseudoflavonifractor sp.]|nr:pyruvate kinase [Alloprevotella sp.]MCM1116933.1 pyruvate kinase [Pseudoflavonifractor sp.]
MMTTPIVMATLASGRATSTMVEAMVRAGMRGVRLNSAHATPEEIIEMTKMVRSVDPTQIILVDTKGAEVRTTALASDADELPLLEGARITITDGGAEPTSLRHICITASGICSLVKEGMIAAVDDGEIMLRVERVTTEAVECRVTKGGRLGSRKTVNFRGIELNALPSLTERDRAAIEASIEGGVDIIAHSFVRTAADVEAVKECCGSSGPKVFAKIECPEGVMNMASILEASDGLLCARGDLGATMGLERVGVLEMGCIELCRRQGKPLIIATQLLHSMMDSPSPTRAEVMDITFAARSGVYALLLTGETAKGKYPIECVDWTHRIAEAALNPTHCQ